MQIIELATTIPKKYTSVYVFLMPFAMNQITRVDFEINDF